MGRISDETRRRNEEAIRAAMDRLLRGQLPAAGRLDLSMLATEAGVTRTGFYPKRNRDGSTRQGPYQHLAEEFERRLNALKAAGDVIDPRTGQIERLKEVNAKLKNRLSQQESQIGDLIAFKQLAMSRIAAQHLEIERLRVQAARPGVVRQLPQPRKQTSNSLPEGTRTAPHGSCS